MVRNCGKLVIGMCLVLFGGRLDALAEVPAGEPAVRLVGPPQYDEQLDATFSAGFTADGSGWSEIQSRDLRVEKWVDASGHAALALNYQRDRVVFSVSDGELTVTREGRSASYRPVEGDAEGIQAQQDAVRMVLIGSTAVRAFRAFTAAIERRTDLEKPFMIAALIDGALVATLDGDFNALDRIGNRITRPVGGLRQTHAVGGSQFPDCLTLYYQSIHRAWGYYTSCYDASSFWSTLIWGPICAVEYIIRADGAFFQLLSCFAIPIPT